MSKANEDRLLNCGCNTSRPGKIEEMADEISGSRKVLSIELLVIDLRTCKRCIPTGNQLRKAIEILRPAADALGIELRYRETIVRSPEEAKEKALLTSPTIRINGHDIAQDIRESACESCTTLTHGSTIVDCRDWYYRGQLFPHAPLPMLIEAIMEAMLKIDEISPFAPTPIEELPANLQRYFDHRNENEVCCG